MRHVPINAPLSRNDHYDVIVVGGGAAGIGAAVGAARVGARTLLVERYGFLGGAATISQVATYCGFFSRGETPEQVVAGAGQEVLDELSRLGVPVEPFQVPSTGNWIFPLEPEATKVAAERTALNAGAELLLHARVIDAQGTSDRLEAVTLVDSSGPFTIAADAFVDASGDANLAYLARARVREGDGEGNFQNATLALRLGGVAPDAPLDREAVARAVEAYNARVDTPLPRTTPLMIRLPASREVLMLIVDEAVTAISSISLTRAEISAREQAWKYLRAFRESGVPGLSDAYLAATGPQLGIRESRHVIGRDSVDGDALVTGQKRDDGIGRAAWPVELHPRPGETTYEHIQDSYADIPYGALQVADLDNVWCAGRTISCDSKAYGSIRVMGTSFATGQAAGVGAACFQERGEDDVTYVRKQLAAQGALI